RELQPQITRETPPKAVVIFGARQIGKTTLLTELSQYEKSVRWFNGDLITDHRQLQFSSSTDVELTLRQADTIIIDEAQRFPNIGLILKQLVDVNIRLNLGKKIFATGSSSLELAKGVKESAVGRLVHRQMWPLSISEIAAAKGWGEISQNIERLMIYGTYPAVFTDPDHAESTLRNYCDGVLYKDLFALAGIRQNEKFMHLVKLLAYNVGSEVNYDNLARDTGLSRTTVADYLQLLEQCFIIKICPSFSRNLSNELKKGKKVYFCDNGVRNAIIGDFSPMVARPSQDGGALWENFFFMERVKLHSIRNDFTDMYFWRTTSNNPHELDFLEVKNERIRAFECKLSSSAKARPGKFTTAYPDAPIDTVTPDDLMRLWFADQPMADNATDSRLV
ncbi:MAG: ATP-binding protein, partial [Sutterella wadsworthensis]